MPRLFIGLELPAEQAASLIALAEPTPGLHWQSPAQLHVTLRFLGDLGSQAAAQLQRTLCELQYPCFAMQVSGVGYFGLPARPSIFWAGIADPEPLQGLRAALDQALVNYCATDPQRFVPHVTLARCGTGAKSLAALLAKHRQLQLPAWRVNEFCLFASDAAAEGSRYSVLARYPLCSLTDGDPSAADSKRL